MIEVTNEMFYDNSFWDKVIIKWIGTGLIPSNKSRIAFIERLNSAQVGKISLTKTISFTFYKSNDNNKYYLRKN